MVRDVREGGREALARALDMELNADTPDDYRRDARVPPNSTTVPVKENCYVGIRFYLQLPLEIQSMYSRTPLTGIYLMNANIHTFPVCADILPSFPTYLHTSTPLTFIISSSPHFSLPLAHPFHIRNLSFSPIAL